MVNINGDTSPTNGYKVIDREYICVYYGPITFTIPDNDCTFFVKLEQDVNFRFTNSNLNITCCTYYSSIRTLVQPVLLSHINGREDKSLYMFCRSGNNLNIIEYSALFPY